MSESDSEVLLKDVKTGAFSVLDCISQLKKYSGSIGVQYELIQRLSTFSYDEIEFFIPQLIQLLVVYDNVSMALEEFILDYCWKFPHFSLIIFWNLQAYIFELKNDPQSVAFQTVKKLISETQDIMFNSESFQLDHSNFRENLKPAVVLCGMLASSFGAPKFKDYSLPLTKSQARQQKSLVFTLANFQKSLTRNLTMKNQKISSERVSADSIRQSRSKGDENISALVRQRSSSLSKISAKRTSFTASSDDSEAYTTDDDECKSISDLEKTFDEVKFNHDQKYQSKKYTEVENNLKINTVIKSKKRLSAMVVQEYKNKNLDANSYNSNSHSLPDLSRIDSRTVHKPKLSHAESESSLQGASLRSAIPKSYSQKSSTTSPQTYDQRLRLLQVNYAKKETQFMMALQNISLRLSQVPKEARISALRAELSIINKTMLPSEIDIPQLLPITSNRNKKYHKILKLNVNEASVLNSAERVPFLLLVEYLSDETDFNPFTEANQKIIASKRINHDDNRGVSSQQSEDLMKGTTLGHDLYKDVNENENDQIYTPDDEETDLSELIMLNKSEAEYHLKSKSPTLQGCRKTDTEISNLLSLNKNEVSTIALADQMRIAAVMLQQLDNSGKAKSEQSDAIRNRIISSMISLQDKFESINFDQMKELITDEQDAGQRKLENDFKISEDWSTKKQRIRKSSAYGHLRNWDLCSVIVKNGDDLPQEAFACQLISMISSIWKRHGILFWTKRMKILITSANAGLVETITNAMSVHSIKKSLTEFSIVQGENAKGRIFTIQDYFQKLYGDNDSAKHTKAQENFAISLASYSIICYVLQIKDRHNGNIMLDHEGHIIHIDFGFLLSNSPGSVGFEAAPFKLTSEYVDVLGGLNSKHFQTFLNVCKECFKALRKEWKQIVSIVELMQKDSTLPCFNNGENTSVLLQQRLHLDLSEEETDSFVENYLIGKSIGSMYTRLYDQFQMITQGIYS